MFDKKYTMEEFEKMFLEAQAETVMEMSDKISKNGESNATMMLTSMLITACLHKNLFNKEDKDNE